MSTARFRKSWLFLPLALLLVVSAPSADRVEVLSRDLVFVALDGSSEDLDGLADGIWTVPRGMALEGRLVCGEEESSARTQPCAMALRVEGDLVVRAGGGIAADAGLRLEVAGDFRLERGSFVVAERGAVELSARGRIEIDGLVSANRTTASKGRARNQKNSAVVVLESTGGPGRGVRIGPLGTVLATGGAGIDSRVEVSGCGLDVFGLVASLGSGPASGVAMRSCEDLNVDGRDLSDPAGARRGRVEIQGPDTARIDLFARGSVRLDGAELRVANQAERGVIAVTAEHGRLDWRRGVGATGASGSISLTACEGIDSSGSRLAPRPNLVEACAGIRKSEPASELVELPTEFSGIGISESPVLRGSGASCTPNLAVDNMVISTFEEFISCNVLTSSNTRIIPRGRVTYRALTSIVLGNGFSVEGSSRFTAIIDPTLNQPPSITSDGGGATAAKSIPENTTAVTDVDATDPEGETESGGGLTYSLSGDDAAKFSIDAAGILAFVTAPDFDVAGDADSDNDYEVTVTVTDTGLLSDAQDITVTVTDVNEAPVITSDGGGATAAVSVDENTTAVTTVTATDEDVPAQTLTFSISGGADMAKFSIVGTTGVLTFSSAPDFEAPGDANMDNDYEVEVTVTDDGTPNLSDVQTLTVTVDDANDAPVITSDGGGATASVSVDENTTAVTDVDATDPEGETESGGGLTYSLSGADAAKFSIDAAGILDFIVAPDFDIPGDMNGDNDYEVTVKVTDSGGAIDTQDITVTVTDVNEAPVITSDGGGATAAVSVDENTTAVTTVTATDEDVPAQTLTFSITGGADMAKFSIVGTTGVLTFATPPDFEVPGDANMDNDYEVEVTVTDDGAPNLSDVQALTVTVDDANDAPVITSDGGGATASVSVDENTTAVTTVTATDADLPAQTLTYSISGGADMAKFSIVGTTGVLSFAAAPDFDIPGDANMDNDYEVQVTVTDDGAPNLSDIQDITVTVDDVNEAPVITSDGGGATASVSVDENTTAVTTVTATDEDVPAQMLTFSITGGADSAKFSIVGSTGVLTFSSAPDFESPGDADSDNDYEVEVTVTDDGMPNLSDVQALTVTVDDANDAPVITSNGGGATASVSVDENTTTVTTVTATDADLPAQTLTYSISGGADMAKFSIVGTTGVLTFAAAPDFDIPGDANMDNDYEVQVTVTDDGAPNLTDIQDITVTVDDVNEAPVITSDGGGATASVSVDENQTAVTTVVATDEDVPAQTLTYSISGGADMAKFSIVGATGVLTFATPPDFESPGDADSDNDYEVEVTVTDDGMPNLSDVQDITVTVEDANDAPVITSNGGGATASVSVDENTTAVTTVTATDADVPAQTLTYSISGGADMAKFSIVGATGVLTFSSAPNFEVPGDANMDNDYEVEVTVTDDGMPNLSDVQDITVTVDDVNEAPVITSNGGGATASVSVDENTTAVTTVTATDVDTPPQTLTYSISGGADSAKFSIVGTTGVLTFSSAPDFESPGDADSDNDYEVEVTVTDDGTPNLSDVQDITVTVDNVDEAPVGGADAFDFVGNTLLLVDKTTSGSPEILATTTSTNGVLDNDFDPEMAAISVSGVFANMTPCADMTAPFTDCPTTNGGKVTMESTGEFSYTPKAGDTLGTDKFGYNVSDGVNTTDVVVTLTRKNRVWYVKNDNTSGTDDGTSADPFDTLAEASTASLDGDTIFVFEGAGTTAGQDAGISLKTMQRLLGEGVALKVPDTVNGVVGPTLFAAGTKPAIEHATAMMDGITVDATAADRVGIEIRGLAISGARNAIDVTSAVTFAVGVTITDNLFDDSGAEAIDLNPGGSGDFIATIEDNTFATSSPTGNAIDVVTTATAGDVEVSINNNTDITSSGGAGINIDGSLGTGTLFVTGFADNTVHGNTGGTGISILGATFDSDTGTAGFQEVDAGTTAVGSVANAVGGSGMILGSPSGPVSGNLSFDQLDAFGVSGTGLAANGTGAATGGSPPTAGFALGITTGTVSETSGKGLELDSLTAGITLASLISTSSSNDSNGQGVDIASVVGTVTISAGTIMHTGAATAFDVGDTGDMTGGNANITYAGSITNTNGRAVLIQQRSGGTITLSGNITETGNGIRLANNTDGDNTITFSGTTKTVNTGTGTAVRLDNNESGGNEATINFTGGGLDIDVTSGIGLHATGGGILNVTGSANSITTSGTGQAVVMNGIEIGVSDVTFANISSTGTGGSAPTSDALSFVGVTNAGTFNGGTVDIDGTGGSADGIDINGSSATFNFASATIDNTGGAGINLNGANGTVTFTTVNIDGTTGAGIDIASNTNAVSINGGSIGSSNDPAGNAVDVNGGSGNVTVAAGISKTTAGEIVEVTGRTSGTVTISGSLSCTASCSGINVSSNTGGSTTFSGGTKTVNTGANTAVNLATNSGHTINFTNGGLDIDTTTAAGFSATGGGTVTVQGSNNRVTSGTGTAVNIASTTIAAAGVTFQSIDVNAGGAATTAINLDTTGAGAFTITGDGSTGTLGGNGTGGTIQNITNTDAIKLESTGGAVTFQNLTIQDIQDSGDAADGIGTRSERDGIHGQMVNGGLVLKNVTLRRFSDNAILGSSSADGLGFTVWNGLEIRDSLLEDSNRYHLDQGAGGDPSDDLADDNNEGLVRILGIKGTVTVVDSTLRRGAEMLDLFTDTSGTMDMTVQGCTFTESVKEFLCSPPGTVNVGKNCIDVEVRGSNAPLIKIGDPNEASSALGNTFTNCGTASVRLLQNAAGTGAVKAVISENDFIITDHLTGPASCAGGSLQFNHPQGGVSLNTGGNSTFEGIVSNNLFDQVMHASGFVGQLALIADDSGVAEFIVRGNEFKLPWDGSVEVQADGNSDARIHFDSNTYTDGTVGSASDDVGFVTQSPFNPFLVNVRNGGSLDITFEDEDLHQHDDVNSAFANSFDSSINASGGTLDLYIFGNTECTTPSPVPCDSKSPDGYNLERNGGTFNLFTKGSCPDVAASILSINDNSGGAGMAGVPNPAIDGDNTKPPVVATTGTITCTTTAPILPSITIP